MHAKRNTIATCFSAVMPGLGQIYQKQVAKGVFFLLIFGSAVGIFYVNSLPIAEWRDLLRFEPTTEYIIELWRSEDGGKLIFQPHWYLKVSAMVQGGLCWLCSIITTRKD